MLYSTNHMMAVTFGGNVAYDFGTRNLLEDEF